ncbi:MAG: branched-chain amino acid transaminase [Actinobacteria bacterium]|nr:branched-chain amino acid transaminase [Actinomycetota bacterium]
MPIEPVDKIWMNGRLVDWDDAKVHVLTHALHYGSGVFEGVRCYHTDRGPAVFRLRDHYERLHRSGRIFQMEIPYSVEELVRGTFDVIKANALEECYIRPLAYRGFGGEMGVNPAVNPVDVSIAVWAWGAYLGEEAVTKGVRVTVSSWRRGDPNNIPPNAKTTGAYINASMAKLEATQSGFDEALMLNPSGRVAEATGQNLFMAKNGELLTPPLVDGPLPGITRESVIQIAHDQGISLYETSLTRADLYTADELFLTGSATEVIPICEIDGRTFDCGPITQTLQQKYSAIVRGEDQKYVDWLDFVEA